MVKNGIVGRPRRKPYMVVAWAVPLLMTGALWHNVHEEQMMRRFALITALLGTLFGGWHVGPGAAAAEHRTVRDALWIWAHYEGSYNNAWGLPGNSRLTPLDGAKSMGVQNLILIRYEGKPEPPYDAYAAPLGSLKKLMWSITGAGGTTSDKDRDQVFALAAKMPNLTGVFMDDFFRDLGTPPAGLAENNMPVQAALSVENLRQLRQRLTVNGRKLDLGVTLYTYQLDRRIIPHLKQCDIVSLWTWEAADLARLEENFAKCRMLMPGKRILLGLYMWDFGTKRPMPLDLMKKQCALALRWLREGRIEGMILLATNICDLNLETVNWTRSWVAEVGNQPLEGAR